MGTNYRKRYTKKITKIVKQPTLKLKMNCHRHGEIIGYTNTTNPGIYESLNEDRTEVVLKCYKCLEEIVEEKEKEASRKVIEKFGELDIEHNLGDPYKYNMASAITLFLGIGSSLYINRISTFEFAILNAVLFGIVSFLLWKRSDYLEKKTQEDLDKSREISFYHMQNSIGSPQSIIESNAKKVLKWRMEQTQIKQDNMDYSFKEIDKMTGIEFEYFVMNLLQKSGYEDVRITKASGDEGVDLTALKKGKKIAIQCKRYKDKITNKAIQEVFSGKHVYKCDEAYVITNSYFTDNAILLAKNHKVKLINRDQLFDLLEKTNENIYRNRTETQEEFNF